MSFERLTQSLENISALPDRPNDATGMTAAALKAAFDAAGLAVQTYINTVLLPSLEGPGAAGNIGIETITGLTAATVQQALAALKEAIDNTAAGSIPDGSLETAKYADLSVTTAKLSELAVTTAKLAALAVTEAKLAANAVTTAKIKDSNVTEAKIAGGAVTANKLGQGAVTESKIAGNSVGTEKVKDGAITLVKTSGIQGTIHEASGTLTAAGWNSKAQSLTVTGMASTSKFVAAPADAASWAAAQEATLYPPTAGDGSLAFTCEDTPTTDIVVTIYWWD